MKLLMFYAHRFTWTPSIQVLEDADAAQAGEVDNAVLGFVQVEQEDVERESKTSTRLVKNLKWLATKNDTKQIVLHSFSHLSESKAPPEFSRQLLNRAGERLENAGYAVRQTPYGHFVDLELKAPGHPLARVFKSF